MENRAASGEEDWASTLPQPPVHVNDAKSDRPRRSRPTLDAQMRADADFVIIDTPGRDDAIAKAAIGRCDTLVTPINDSFVDFDLIGQVDPDSYKVKRPSFYAEVVWDARKVRAKLDGGTVDWVVLRNRLQHIEARNMKRVAAALGELSKRVGLPRDPRPVRTRHLSRTLSAGADAAGSRHDRGRGRVWATSPRARNCARWWPGCRSPIGAGPRASAAAPAALVA